MEASGFHESNHVLGPPEGATEEQVHSLACFVGVDEGDYNVVVSCWRPTQEEINEIQRTGRIWLTVMGNSMPPVRMQAFKPFKKEGENVK